MRKTLITLMPKSKMPPSVRNLSDEEYDQWYAVYSKNKNKGKDTAAKMAWGAIKKESKMNKLSILEFAQAGGMGTQGRQDPRTVTLKKQLISLIDTTDFDDNQSVDRLRLAIEQILRQA